MKRWRDPLLFVAPLAALLAFVLWRSTGWRMRHDLPMMMYQAFLMDRHGYVPYRDFFDMNLPGTYATYLLIGKVFGYGDAGMRAADLTWMAALSATAVVLLRRTSPIVAALAPVVFLLMYLRGGGELTLQREALALVPIGLGLVAATSTASIRARSLLAGLAFGCAATLKPHLAIGVLPVAAWLLPEWRRDARAAGLGLLGLALPVALALGVLAALGALDDFLRGLPYLGLYSHLSGAHRALAGADRAWYLASEGLELGGHTVWIVAAAFGFGLAWDDRRARLLAGCLAAYAVYPFFTGQFWPYHWLPTLFFAAIGAASLLRAEGAAGTAGRVVLALLIVQLSQVTRGLESWDREIEQRPQEGRPDTIARYLEDHLSPGDTVQPFDWILGGVCHGMLRAEAVPATSFLYTFHFYHHVSDPTVVALRERFMAELRAAPPKVVVVSRVHWPFARGADTTTAFPAFDGWLVENYVRVDDFRVKGVEMWQAKEPYSR